MCRKKVVVVVVRPVCGAGDGEGDTHIGFFLRIHHRGDGDAEVRDGAPEIFCERERERGSVVLVCGLGVFFLGRWV